MKKDVKDLSLPMKLITKKKSKIDRDYGDQDLTMTRLGCASIV